jgi:DNA-binding GntR family transcriptional regulator
MTVLEPIIREKTLGATAYGKLKRALITGAFQPGTKLTVRGVAESLDISITPARDALSRLIAEGALEAKGPKTVVVPPLSFPILREITRIRLALEGMAAEMATPNIDGESLELLEHTQQRLNAAMEQRNYVEVLSANEIFHFTIYRAANMPRLLSIIESQWLRIGPSLNLLYPEFAISRRGISNHTTVLDGLRSGEPGVVRGAIEQDLRDGFDRLRRMIESQQAA